MMKNSILLKVLTLVGVTLLASSGWGFETNVDSEIKEADLTISKSSNASSTDPGGDLTVQGTLKVGTVNNASVPRGVIVMWSGGVNVGDIPAGWALCDGNTPEGETTATPNLSGKFVVGYNSANTDYDGIGDSGGNDSLILTQEQMPRHSHLYVGAGSYGRDDPGSGNQMADNTWGSTEPTGEGQAFDNRPAYYVVAYIIKL